VAKVAEVDKSLKSRVSVKIGTKYFSRQAASAIFPPGTDKRGMEPDSGRKECVSKTLTAGCLPVWKAVAEAHAAQSDAGISRPPFPSLRDFISAFFSLVVSLSAQSS
jgi:hypothetical protein